MIVPIPSFIINYTPFKERLDATSQTLLQLGILSSSITVVSCWDKERLGHSKHLCAPSEFWNQRIDSMSHILLGNTSQSQDYSIDLFSKFAQLQIPISDVPWLNHRDLGLGEISVLMKHFFAISSIANSDSAFGLIIEDDARYDPTKKQLFDELIQSLHSSRFDYVDLAGGCGLLPSREELASSRDGITCTLQIPRTRTNAAYIISRGLAKVICEAYFPLVFPIDWHLQYLFLKNSGFHYTWTNTPLLIHGSERGYVTSWRQNNGFS